MEDRGILIDVSRLIWRLWTRRLPTGIDRVCIAYLDHFGSRARAVVQFRNFRHILNRTDSGRLFSLLLDNPKRFRTRLSLLLARAAFGGDAGANQEIYLNIGHTGLNSPFLPRWLAERGLLPVYLIHDLIPVTHPEYCRAGEAERHRQRMIHALETARGIIVNSSATERELQCFATRHGLPFPKCLVAWLGVDRTDATALAHQSAGRPYFVMVGTIEARKNHKLILEVWTDLVRRLGAS